MSTALPEPPHPSQPESDARKHCFRLIREITGRLGWRYKLWIPAAVILSSVFLLPPRLLQYFTEGIDRIEDASAEDFLISLGIFGTAIGLCLWISIFLTGILREWLRLTISNELKRDSVRALSKTRIDKLDSAKRGDWMTRLTGDLHNAEEFLTISLPDQIQNFTMVVGAAALFFFHSGPVALIPLAAALLLAFLNIFVQRKMGPTLAEAREIEGGVFQTMIETFEGLRTIRSFGGEKFTMARINQQLSDLFRAGMRVVKSMGALMGLNETTGQLVITAILTLVAFQIQGGDLTVTDALVYPFFINTFLGAAKELVASAYDWNRFFIEGGRLASVLYAEENQIEEAETVSIENVLSLGVQGLSISYEGFPPVISDFDFTIETGQIVAIQGPSGCGKSTFLETFAGLRHADQGGFVVAYETGEPREFHQAPTALSAFVEQQPYLFVGSIRDNIAFGNDAISDMTIREALESVDLYKQFNLDHVLSDRGRNLSVGQQYRLALCRALVSAQPFLLLDEPFAALDEESIVVVAKALESVRQGERGVVIVTHILHDAVKLDQVVEI